MKEFILIILAAAILSATLGLALIYGVPAIVRASYEPNHDAWRAEQYHNYLVRKGHINVN